MKTKLYGLPAAVGAAETQEVVRVCLQLFGFVPLLESLVE